jgi:hypothetical protein
MKKNNQGFIQIVIMILLLLVVGGAAYYFGTQKGNISLNPTSTPISSTVPSSNIVTKPTSDPTANWGTYTDKTYGLSFKFPSGYFVYKCPSDNSGATTVLLLSTSVYKPNQKIDCGFTDSSDLSMLIEKTLPSTNPADQQENQRIYLIQNEAVNIGGVNTNLITYSLKPEVSPDGYTPWFTELNFEKNGEYYTITLKDKEFLNIFNQILSTFKFAN